MPDRQDNLLTGNSPSDNSIEFIASPSLFHEGPGKNNNSEPATGNALVNLPAETITDPHFKFVIPDTESFLPQFICQRSDNFNLVFAGVSDEDIVLDIFILPRMIMANQRGERGLTQFRKRLGENASRRTNPSAKTLQIDNDIPPTRRGDRQADRGLLGKPSNITMLTPTLISVEIRDVHQPDIGSAPGKGELHNFAPLAMAQIVMPELHSAVPSC